MSNTNVSTEAVIASENNQLDCDFFPDDIKTIKAKNANNELSKTELLKLLCYMEGEIQARDICIAVLKTEKVKNLMNLAAYGAPIESTLNPTNDPHAAFFRDSIAQTGNIASRHSSAIAAQSEQFAREMCEKQLLVLSQKVEQQRQTHLKTINLLKQTRDRHLKLMQELDEEKKKRELEKSAGITSSEKALMQEKLTEVEASKILVDNELKKLKETLESERIEHKEIIIYLLEERRKINMMRNEERKRSEDLAQILSEEKQRSDTIAEGLEEETKKSLRCEAEMEKQSQIYEQEKKMTLRNLALEEKKVKDLEMEITRLRIENESLKKAALGSGANSMISNVAKVIQPTSTISSVPVSGPTTGIARSPISPGQILRQESASSMTTGTNVATIIRAHNVQVKTPVIQPTPPLKKNQIGVSARQPPPIPPNKPLLNKANSTTTAATNSSRITFLQSQTVPGVSQAAQAIAAQNAKDSEE